MNRQHTSTPISCSGAKRLLSSDIEASTRLRIGHTCSVKTPSVLWAFSSFSHSCKIDACRRFRVPFVLCVCVCACVWCVVGDRGKLLEQQVVSTVIAWFEAGEGDAQRMGCAGDQSSCPRMPSINPLPSLFYPLHLHSRMDAPGGREYGRARGCCAAPPWLRGTRSTQRIGRRRSPCRWG